MIGFVFISSKSADLLLFRLSSSLMHTNITWAYPNVDLDFMDATVKLVD